VVARLTFRGTHTDTFFGLTAYGSQVEFMSINMLRVDGGKFVEHWGSIDLLHMLRQLGVIPSPEQFTSYNP